MEEKNKAPVISPLFWLFRPLPPTRIYWRRWCRNFLKQFKNFRIYKELYEKPWKRDWVAKVVFLIEMLLTFGGRYNCFFWDTRMKILRLLNFNMLFQLVHWTVFVFTESRSRVQVMQRAYCHPSGYQKHRQQHKSQEITTARAKIIFNNVRLSVFSLCPNTVARKKRGKTCCSNNFQGTNLWVGRVWPANA